MERDQNIIEEFCRKGNLDPKSKKAMVRLTASLISIQSSLREETSVRRQSSEERESGRSESGDGGSHREEDEKMDLSGFDVVEDVKERKGKRSKRERREERKEGKKEKRKEHKRKEGRESGTNQPIPSQDL